MLLCSQGKDPYFSAEVNLLFQFSLVLLIFQCVFPHDFQILFLLFNSILV